MIEHQLALVFCSGFEFKSDDRIISGLPVGNVPCLDDSLSGYELYCDSQHHWAEAGKLATILCCDLGRSTSEFTKLVGSGERVKEFVDVAFEVIS